MDILYFNGDGYKPIVSYNGWRVAIANACERLFTDNPQRLERHLESDEVFILLCGEATLHIGVKSERHAMLPGMVYNVKRGEWHAITMIPGTKVAIIENDDTCEANTEFMYLS